MTITCKTCGLPGPHPSGLTWCVEALKGEVERLKSRGDRLSASLAERVVERDETKALLERERTEGETSRALLRDLTIRLTRERDEAREALKSQIRECAEEHQGIPE